MPPTPTIDYSKFKIEVFSPDGISIKEAMISAAHNFYCSGLTPGQEYLIAFSYDEILLLCASFTCDSSGRVIYLSPANFLFNNALGSISMKAGAELAKIVKRREDYKISFQSWEKQLIENILSVNAKVGNLFSNPHGIPCFEAGNETATKLK